jgi:hypothetical protein
MNLSQKIQRFRKKILDCIHSLKQNDKEVPGLFTRSQTVNGIELALFRALLTDFDRLFSPTIFSNNAIAIRNLARKYCVADTTKCPLCGLHMTRKSKNSGTRYYSCTGFPDCKGARSINGVPSINDALKEFLDQKIEEDVATNDVLLERFSNLGK